jgi:hypothetical protein
MMADDATIELMPDDGATTAVVIDVGAVARLLQGKEKLRQSALAHAFQHACNNNSRPQKKQKTLIAIDYKTDP